MSESVNIAGNFNGTLIVNGSETTGEMAEEYLADVMWMGVWSLSALVGEL